MDPVYETLMLLEAMNTTPRPKRFLRNKFFGGRETTFPTYAVGYDIQKGRKAIAPFVNRRGAGRMVEKLDLTTKLYVPPRMGPFVRITGDDIQQFRAAGEAIGGSLSNSDRQLREVTRRLAELDDLETRAEELMIAQLLSTGVMTIAGEDVADTITVGHTMTGNAALAWNNANALPLNDVETAALAVMASTGKYPDTCILGMTALGEFNGNAQVIAEKGVRNWVVLEGAFAETPDGAMYLGTFKGINFYVYPEQYFNEATGLDAAMVPAEMAIIGCSAAKCPENEILYGAYHSVAENRTYEGARIPLVTIEEGANAIKVQLMSHPIPCIKDVDTWYRLNT